MGVYRSCQRPRRGEERREEEGWKAEEEKGREGGRGQREKWSVEVTKEDQDKKERMSTQKTRVW